MITVALAGCGSPVVVKSRASLPSLRLASSAFADAARIPARFTCDGAGVSPPLQWADPPAGTAQLAIVVDDPDAAGRPFVHWVVWNLAPSVRALAVGALPAGAVEGPNSDGRNGWTPPCPPTGEHHYRFRLYALRRAPDVPSTATPQDVIGAINLAAIGDDQLNGTYARG